MNDVRINDAFVTLVALALGREDELGTLLRTAKVHEWCAESETHDSGGAPDIKGLPGKRQGGGCAC